MRIVNIYIEIYVERYVEIKQVNNFDKSILGGAEFRG